MRLYEYFKQIQGFLKQNELRSLIIEHQQIVNNIQRIELFVKKCQTNKT